MTRVGTPAPVRGLKTARTQLRRKPQRGRYDLDAIAAILDQAFVCHVGFAVGGQPYAIPTGFGREGDVLYVHGSFASRMMKELRGGLPMCITVTILDGLVLARSGFHSSVNYRSVVVLGKAELVDGAGKEHALEVISDHILPGRWADLRPNTAKELRATTVLKVRIEEASAKVRSGPPLDDARDLALDCWAGVLPYRLAPGMPVPDPQLAPGVAVPAYLRRPRRPGAESPRKVRRNLRDD